MAPRVQEKYENDIKPMLMKQFGFSSVHQTPRITKIVVNMGVGDAIQDARRLEEAQDHLMRITGQRPAVRRARKSIASFKLREGMPIGLVVTLRRPACTSSLTDWSA